MVAYKKHRQHLYHKKTVNGFCQMFNGREAHIRAKAAHNVHEHKEAGRIQEGGTAIILFGELAQQYDNEGSGRDETGLGRITFIRLKGADRIVTQIICGYNLCKRKNLGGSCQQQRQFYIEKKATCHVQGINSSRILSTNSRSGRRRGSAS